MNPAEGVGRPTPSCDVTVHSGFRSGADTPVGGTTEKNNAVRFRIVRRDPLLGETDAGSVVS